MSEEEFLNRTLNKIDKEFGYDVASTLELMFIKKEKEIDRLNNIINELNEDIYHLLNVIGDNKDDIKVTSDEELAIFSCQNRLEELKENK